MLDAQNIYPKQDPVDYKFEFIVPKEESVRSHSDRYELLHDYKNNTLQFTQVKKVISTTKNNSCFRLLSSKP